MEQKQKYVYVDYENMGNIKELAPINGKYFFFIGSNQKTVPSSLVVATNGMSVEWIIIEGTGKMLLWNIEPSSILFRGELASSTTYN